MIKALLSIIFVGGFSLRFVDLSNDSAFFSMFLPFLVFMSALALALWFVTLFHKRGISQNAKVRHRSTLLGFFSSDGDL